MLEANKTITLFNKYRDYDKNERWLKTVICGVSWFFSKSIIVSKEGKTEREVCTIRIPNSAKSEGKVYIDSKSFAKGKREKHWTVSGGDKIVLGNAISAPLDENLPTFLEKNYSNVVTALTVSDNRGKILPHIKIGTV